MADEEEQDVEPALVEGVDEAQVRRAEVAGAADQATPIAAIMLRLQLASIPVERVANPAPVALMTQLAAPLNLMSRLL